MIQVHKVKKTAAPLFLWFTCRALGWDTLQIDEGWEACADYGRWNGAPYTTCKKQTPRDAQGRIVANNTKFPVRN